jgi:S-DNA-T family DNA segregation ATPase FtsK/SpoIIIE
MTSNTLAATAVQLASLVLTRSREAHQCFRVKNLHENEVVQFVAAWPEAAKATGIEKVRLIVADSLNERIPEKYVAEVGCSITHYRNNNPNGLVYVETSVQSDEQGLQNMFSLRDSNFLDGSFDEYASPPHGVAGMLVEKAWKGVEGQSDVPVRLLEGLLQVIGFINPGIEPVPVRKFIAFSELACLEWIQTDRIKDEGEANRIVGQALWAMGMFPDPNWKEGGGGVRTRRRLELNLRYAELIDGSKELDADEIVERAKATHFKDEGGVPLAAEDGKHWQSRCSAYGRTPTDATLRREIPYWVFSQLFARDTAGLRLGDRVRAELERDVPGRVAEFDSLDVTTGLNLKSSHDAHRFLEAGSEGGEKPLADLIEQATRKSVERIALPPKKRFFNPAIEIVRRVQSVTADTGGTRAVTIRVEVIPEASGSPSHGLFTFLFGATLKAIADALVDVPGACSLLVQPELYDMQAVPRLCELMEPGDEEESEALAWSPLPMRITLSDSAGNVLEVTEQAEWCPSDIEYFALFWLLVAAEDSPALDAVATLRVPTPADGGDWVGPLVRRELSLDSLRPESGHLRKDPHTLLDGFSLTRRQLRGALRASGLEIATLRSFLDKWQEILARAREDFVPDGVRSHELDAFLGCDMLALEREERRIMLPTHPLRLRWICCYLEETRRLAEAFLSGGAAFADGEGDTFLNWLENLTPRESPPLAVGQDGQLLYSRSEVAWFEDFSPERTETGDVGLDSDAVESITGRIISYLDAHPYKRDGLSLLVVLPTSDTMPAEILNRISLHANRAVRVSLYVAAPKLRWDSIARAVELISDDSDGAPRARLFPDRDLALIDYQAGGDMRDLLADLQLDIAVVTHALQEQVVSQQNTESPIERPGRFDPLHHRPLRLEIGGGGGSISLVMLPKYPDPMLESWSTLAVRANRCRPVAPGQPENTDLVELRVNFQDSARLFRDLHEHCHWVITLERHISREQIESVEAGAPDVLSIEDGVGANGLSTLLVSSRSGRDLAHARIERKLARLIPERQRDNSEPDLLARLAEAIYDSTRSLSPRLALQALGVARVTEEIVGLTVARRLTEDKFPEQISDGISAWLSLDEHTDWFGGHERVRADMCRISISRDASGMLNVDVLVLEGKLRQSYDAHGVLQVSRTRDFFTAILGGTDTNGASKVDAAMWRDLMAAAIETLSNEAVTLGSVTASGTREEVVRNRDLLLSQFRSGEFRLRNVDGVYSACIWQSEDESLITSVEQDVTVLKSTRVHLLELVRPRSCDETQAASAVMTRDQILPHSEVQTAPTDSPRGEASASDDATADFPEPAKAQITQVTPHAEARTPPAGVGSELAVNMALRDVSRADVPSEGSRRGLSDTELQDMYKSVLSCFGTHGISVTAAHLEERPFIEGPASVLFKVRPGPGVDPRKLSEKSSALKLVLALEQEQNVSFNIDKGFVTIDVPKSQAHRYFVDAAETWSRWTRPLATLAVPLGEDRFGAVVELNLSSPNTPHLLVAGTTGSGKSEALNSILRGLVHHYSKDELRLMLVDPKGTELTPIADSASSYLEGAVGWDGADALALLKRAVAEMERRYALFKAQRHRSVAEFNATAELGERLPWWLIVLEEYADLTSDPEAKKSIEAQLKRLAQMARAAGIHVIIATQKPSAEIISTNLRSNLPAQLALRVKNATESRVVMDEAGAENLNGKGDAFFKADGKLQRIQCSRFKP